MPEYYYNASEFRTNTSSNENFQLHTHDEYEIYMFIEGNSQYIVEEKKYDLSPGDMIIIRKNEMHRVFHNSNVGYSRFVLMVSPLFFEKYECSEYESAFLDKYFDESNKIDAEIVNSSGLYDAIMRLKKYTDDYTCRDTPVAHSVVTEILYIINKITLFAPPSPQDPLTKNIISYINNSLQSDITLDRLSKEFFVSKYHLCHIFKKSTGLTINEYVKQKRLTLVNEYIKQGKTLTEAAASAGFSDYSSFYRAYVKNNKLSPRKLKQR